MSSWVPPIVIISYLFLIFFVRRYTPFADRVTPCLQCGNHQWRKCEPDVKKWWYSATRLESGLVTWCMWTNGRIGCKRFLTDQSRKGCFALFLEKYAACNGCFNLMHCRCQIMCVHVPLWKFIHFREIFEWAYTDGVTTFVNMWLCCRQALIFWPINFYYFTVWCLLSLCHLKRKLFKSTMMPVEVLISIVKDWYKWLVSGLVHLLSNDPFKRAGLMPCTLIVPSTALQLAVATAVLHYMRPM